MYFNNRLLPKIDVSVSKHLLPQSEALISDIELTVNFNRSERVIQQKDNFDSDPLEELIREYEQEYAAAELAAEAAEADEMGIDEIQIQRHPLNG